MRFVAPRWGEEIRFPPPTIRYDAVSVCAFCAQFFEYCERDEDVAPPSRSSLFLCLLPKNVNNSLTLCPRDSICHSCPQCVLSPSTRARFPTSVDYQHQHRGSPPPSAGIAITPASPGVVSRDRERSPSPPFLATLHPGAP